MMATKPHRWSGWPGAYCLDCGVDDKTEWCLADHPHLAIEDVPCLEHRNGQCMSETSKDPLMGGCYDNHPRHGQKESDSRTIQWDNHRGLKPEPFSSQTIPASQFHQRLGVANRGYVTQPMDSFLGHVHYLGCSALLGCHEFIGSPLPTGEGVVLL